MKKEFVICVSQVISHKSYLFVRLSPVSNKKYNKIKFVFLFFLFAKFLISFHSSRTLMPFSFHSQMPDSNSCVGFFFYSFNFIYSFDISFYVFEYFIKVWSMFGSPITNSCYCNSY